MTTTAGPPQAGSEDYGVYDDAKTYYTSEERHNNRFGSRTRTYSQVCPRYENLQWFRGANRETEQSRKTVREGRVERTLSQEQSWYVWTPIPAAL